ncbi:hypothetical protein [Aliiroseovarius sp. PrR006]|uniref:hypothetical protein n=1 Tax=Aliiroseovarius sp. PrR006 TaxID=2706883 RepID=UPI0013D6FCAF|nr:hypothetical protein [Aliiroseovarius sp. PrR006]NDW53444.1 hypothetical protein [Aliiroseovarius sp. PrR006]
MEERLELDMPCTSESLVLAETDEFRITYHRHEQDDHSPERTVVITFGTLQSDIDYSGFGTELLLKNGYSTIYVAPKRGKQYQTLSREQFLDAVSDHIHGRRVVAYGASLGAYAAAYYTGALGAELIAVAPQLPALPALGMRHAQTVPILHQDLKEAPRTSGRVVVVWDPHEKPDNILTNDFLRVLYPSAAFVELPFTGHKVLETLAVYGVVADYILSIVEDFTIPPLDLPTTTSHIWNSNYGKKLVREAKPQEALHYLEKSFEMQPSSENIQLLAKVYEQLNLVEAGAKLHDVITSDPQVERLVFNNARRSLASLLGHDPIV